MNKAAADQPNQTEQMTTRRDFLARRRDGGRRIGGRVDAAVRRGSGAGGGSGAAAGRQRDGENIRRDRHHLRQGAGHSNHRNQGIQRHPLWRLDRRAQPLHAAEETRRLERRARVLGARGDQSASVDGSALRLRHDDSLGLSARRHGRGLPQPEYLDTRPQGRRETTGARVLPRRRLHHRIRQCNRLRRRAARALRRCGRGDRQSSARRIGLHATRRSGRARGVRLCRLRGHHGSHGVARMGARQHRKLRRRSPQCDDLRPIRRRRKNQLHAGDARGQRSVSSCRRAERIDVEVRAQRSRHDAAPKRC